MPAEWPSQVAQSGSGTILPWATGTVYVQGQAVTNGGHSYTANDAHTAGATFAGDQGAHWTLLPVTKADVGLGSADNTSDAGKPVSTAQQAALDLLIPKSLVDAKGDLLVGTADNTVARVAVGTDGQVLTADAASAAGAKWSASGVPVWTANTAYAANQPFSRYGIVYSSPTAFTSGTTFSATGLSVLTPGAQRGLDGGWVPLGNHALHFTDPTGHVSNGTDTKEFARWRINPLIAGIGVRLLFPNIARWDLSANAVITTHASIESPSGATPLKVRARGAWDVVVEPDSMILSDAHGIPFAVGTPFFIRNYLTVPSGTWPNATPNGSSQAGEGRVVGTVVTDDTLTNVNPGLNITFGFCPVPLTRPLTRVPLIVGLGDSILAGSGVSGDLETSFFTLACQAASLPFWNLGMSGETVQGFLASPALQRARNVLAQSCDHTLCEYGINDVIANRTLAQIQADLITLWTRYGRGSKAWQTTITPNTTSTDSFATLANQTIASAPQNTIRTNLNAWLVAGAPMSGGVAVAIGTGGALLAGQTGHPLTGVFDVAATVEDAGSPGKWKVDGTANKYTNNGIHPTLFGNTQMATAINAAAFWTLVA